MTEEKAGEIVNVQNLADAQAAVVWSFTAVLPTEAPEDEEEDDKKVPLG